MPKDSYPLRKLLERCPTDLAARIREIVPDADAASLIRKGIVRPVEELAPGERAAIRWVSTRDIDRDREILVPEGAILDEFRKAPQVLWGHNYAEPPIGSDEWITADDYGIKAKTRFAETARAEDIWSLVRDGHLKTSSVGFVPVESVEADGPGWSEVTKRLGKKWGIDDFSGVDRIFTKWLLLEHSDVSVPANINAVVTAVAKGLKVSEKTLSELGIEPGEPWPSEKPYPNEHSCRLLSPGDFQDDSFRRVEREHEGKKYFVIMGRLTGETTMTEQAYRYPKDTWSTAQAKAHCTAHDGSSFEPAKGERMEGNIGPRISRITQIVRPMPLVHVIAEPVNAREIAREVIETAQGRLES